MGRKSNEQLLIEKIHELEIEKKQWKAEKEALLLKIEELEEENEITRV